MTPAVIRTGTRVGHVLTVGEALRCACGSDQIVAVKPGQDADTALGLFAVMRHVPDIAWCRACWPAVIASRSAPC